MKLLSDAMWTMHTVLQVMLTEICVCQAEILVARKIVHGQMSSDIANEMP